MIASSARPAWLWLLLLGVELTFAAQPTPDAGQEGRTLAGELRAQRPTKDSRFEGVLKIRDRAGNLIQVPVRLEVVAGGADWRSVYAAFARDRSPAEKLTVIHSDDQPNGYWLAQGTASPGVLREPVALSGSQATNAFAGSDFSLADLGLEFIHWPEQRVVKHEMRKGRACQVLESVNPHPSAGGYRRVLAWVDVENGGLVRAEAYDHQNRLLKVFAVDKLRKVNGRWELKEIEIRNVQTDTRTHLVYDTEPSSSPKASP